MELLEQIEEYLLRTNVAPSSFGRLAVGDPRLVADLKAGRRLRRRTEERLRGYLNQVGAIAEICRADHNVRHPMGSHDTCRVNG